MHRRGPRIEPQRSHLTLRAVAAYAPLLKNGLNIADEINRSPRQQGRSKDQDKDACLHDVPNFRVSIDCRRSDRGTGSSLDFQRLQDEGELVDPFRRQLVELQILQQMDPVYDQHDLVYRKRECGVGIG